MSTCRCNGKGRRYFGAVRLQLGWNVAYFCVRCGVKRGKSVSLRDDKELEAFTKEPAYERHESNRLILHTAR